jgi:hypothetical protein
MHFLMFTLLALVLAGCQLEPGVSLKEARMAEGPVILQRGDRFYLHYRRSIDHGRMNLLSLLSVKKTKDAAFYFLTIPLSHIEWGEVVERPLAYDRTEDFARHGQVYWLDPDGTKHPIPVQTDH